MCRTSRTSGSTRADPTPRTKGGSARRPVSGTGGTKLGWPGANLRSTVHDVRAADAGGVTTPARPAFAGIYPALFVVLWSTGFIAAKYGLPYAPPFTFLLVRFALVAALMSIVALATRAPWPAWREV